MKFSDDDNNYCPSCSESNNKIFNLFDEKVSSRTNFVRACKSHMLKKTGCRLWQGSIYKSHTEKGTGKKRMFEDVDTFIAFCLAKIISAHSITVKDVNSSATL